MILCVAPRVSPSLELYLDLVILPEIVDQHLSTILILLKRVVDNVGDLLIQTLCHPNQPLRLIRRDRGHTRRRQYRLHNVIHYALLLEKLLQQIPLSTQTILHRYL